MRPPGRSRLAATITNGAHDDVKALSLAPAAAATLSASVRSSPANLPAQSAAPASAPIQVMVLGTYHFGNPGQDLHNMKVDSVLTPAKQAELADVAARLAKFKPTKIAVEAFSDRSDLVTQKFDGFTPEKLITDPDERTQIAFRLAHPLGQKSGHDTDEQC